MYTVTQAAEILGMTTNALANKCQRLGVPKFGKQYIIDDRTLEMLKERKGKRGRPRLEKPEA